MSVLEPFAQDLAARLGNAAHYKIVATIYKGEIANVHAAVYAAERRFSYDVADYGLEEDDSEVNQVNDLTELTCELMAATKNPPTGDVALAELEAFVQTAQEFETFLHDHGYDGAATIESDDDEIP